MNLKSILRNAVMVGASMLPVVAHADDWPQWRGPTRDAISKEMGLLKEWPDDGPKRLWTSKEIGQGYATPAVVGERLYVLGNEGSDNEFVRAMNVSDGKPSWTKRLGKVGPNTPAMNYPGARSTPTVEGDVMYVLGSDGDLACLAIADGAIRWQKNLRTDFGGKPGEWAYAESPLIDGDMLICTPGGPTATMVALKKTSGDVVWKSAIPGGDTAGYASPIPFTPGGAAKQYLQFMQKGLVGVDARDGKFLWRYAATAQNSPANIPTPVAQGDLIYSASGRGGGGAIRLKREGESFQPEQVYYNAKLPNAIGGAVLIGDHLYGAGGQVFICVDFKTGAPKWTNRSIAPGAVLFAEGMLYLHGESGEVALIEASPDAYKEHGRFTPAEEPERGRSKAWAYPVVANGRLYIRDWNVLSCYDVKAPK